MGTNMGIEKPVSLSTQAFEVYLVHLHRGKFSLKVLYYSAEAPLQTNSYSHYSQVATYRSTSGISP